MSKQSLAELRERFKSQKDKKSNFKNGDTYPFWDIKLEDSAIIRILPDGNTENPDMFFIDKLEHFLPINGKNKKIPCIWMYGEKCPICELSQKFYKAGDKIQGKLYWRKKQSLFRAVIIKDPLPADETGETALGKVKTIQFNFQLMQKIMEQISNEDDPLEELPWDSKKGYNFIIKKMKQGEYDNYVIASGFAGKSTPIPAEYLDSIELIDLKTLLPANPGEDTVHALLTAHLTGEDMPDDYQEPPAEADTPKSATTARHTPEDETVVVRRPTKVVEPVASMVEEEEEDPIMARVRKRREAAAS